MNRIIAIFILFSLSCVALFSQAITTLEYKPAKGSVFVTTYETHNITKQEILGINQKAEMKSTIVTESQVEESSPGSTLLSVSYKRMAIESLSPTINFIIDTGSDEEQEGVEYLKALIGKAFHIRLNKRGEILEVTGLEEIMQQIISEIDSSDQAFAQYKMTLDAFFKPEQIKENFMQLNPPFPDKQLMQGDTWDYRLNSGIAQFEYRVQASSKVLEIEKEKVLLLINSTISTPGKIPFEAEGIQAQVEMSGKEVSEVSVDSMTGIVIKGVKKQNISAILEMKTDQTGMKDITVPINITTSMNISVEYE